MNPSEPDIAYTSGNDPTIGVLDIRKESFVAKIKNPDLDKTKIFYQTFIMLEKK